jgi:alpha-glucosidase
MAMSNYRKTVVKTILAGVVWIVCTLNIVAQTRSIDILPNEKWYGGAVDDGYKTPFANGYSLNLYGNCRGNQAVPFLLSSKGRYIWSEEPFSFDVVDGKLILTKHATDLQLDSAGSTLAEAYTAAMHKHFPPAHRAPDTFFTSRPQYNTWIELKYNQNQDGILKYASDLLANGFPPGVLMIDDNWFPYYGSLEFRKDRFKDAVAMMAQLHQMGFKVMVWVSPFISPDTEEFRELQQKGYLVSTRANGSLKPAIIEWWNGFSASLDLTHPDARKWFTEQLNKTKKQYGVDGFKFDAGDPEFYADTSFVFHSPASPNEISRLWGTFGIDNSFNEYRAMWKMGNQPLVQRLRDKEHSWRDLQKIIPDMTAAGMLGYGLSCPDMIGGGEIGSFAENGRLDQHLVVRSAQLQALMPMMQFSIAPWRVLDSTSFNAVLAALKIRNQFLPVIRTLADSYVNTGIPVVRHMEYVFPAQGFADCNDQYMLGDTLMVAPMLTDSNSRNVRFPKGRWQTFDGRIIRGPVTKKIDCAFDQIPWFRLVRN